MYLLLYSAETQNDDHCWGSQTDRSKNVYAQLLKRWPKTSYRQTSFHFDRFSIFHLLSAENFFITNLESDNRTMSPHKVGPKSQHLLLISDNCAIYFITFSQLKYVTSLKWVRSSSSMTLNSNPNPTWSFSTQPWTVAPLRQLTDGRMEAAAKACDMASHFLFSALEVVHHLMVLWASAGAETKHTFTFKPQ